MILAKLMVLRKARERRYFQLDVDLVDTKHP